MDDKVVVLRIGEHLLSLPFIHVDEILSADAVTASSDLPEGAVVDDAVDSMYVLSKGRWLCTIKLLPGQEAGERSQIVVVMHDGSAKALLVDQVVGIEKSGMLVPFPEVVSPFMDIPFAGVRFLKDQPALELDLSRLISLDRGDCASG